MSEWRPIASIPDYSLLADAELENSRGQGAGRATSTSRLQVEEAYDYAGVLLHNTRSVCLNNCSTALY